MKNGHLFLQVAKLRGDVYAIQFKGVNRITNQAVLGGPAQMKLCFRLVVWNYSSLALFLISL